jgi:hypothetical protein
MYEDQYQRTKKSVDMELDRWAKKLGYDSIEDLRDEEKQQRQTRRDYKKSQGFNS